MRDMEEKKRMGLSPRQFVLCGPGGQRQNAFSYTCSISMSDNEEGRI